MANPSLLHYLTGTKAPFSLGIVSGFSALKAETAPLFPFEIIDDTSALTRIIRARVGSDAGSVVKQVFLLLSRDDYPLTAAGLNPLTNMDIESAWQDAFRNHVKGGSLIALSAQGDEKGGLEPFRSIFSCTKFRQFFGPPCPQCGKELELCRDDTLLGKAGLNPYSKTLARYLACPVCSLNEGDRTFYSYAPDAADPVQVKGTAELIMGFGELKNGDLPCIRCPEHTACYQDRHVLSVILPVAFYPFYLLMFEAASLNACDYLSLLSGAPFEEMEQTLDSQRQFARKGLVRLLKDRANSPLLFTGDAREFLEVLYLKLCFLGEVAGYVLSDKRRFTYPGFGPSLDRLWVQISEQSSLLPAFWTFKLTLMDMEPEIPGVLPSAGSDYATHCMGMLWFHALVRNRSQDIRAINEGIVAVLKKKQIHKDMPVFGPENIFWEPRPAPVKWKGLWDKALDIGRALLLDAGKPGFLLDEFWQAFHNLRDEIKKELFLEATVVQAFPEAPGEPLVKERSDDAQIGLILKQIKSKWAQAGTVTPADEKPKPDAITLQLQSATALEDDEATIIITPAKPSVQEEAQEEYSQTVVLAARPQQQGTAAQEDEDFSTETIIMRHPGASAVAPVSAKEPVDLDKTVVMNPVPSKAVPKAKEGPLKRPAENELDETLIMGAPVRGAPAAAQKGPVSAADALEETVILKPEKK
jgi:hypothetical protein